MSRPGDKLRRPLNAPGTTAPTPGVQAGNTPAVQIAQFFIAFGISGQAAGGVFLYNGQPANGNPPIAYMSNASQDPYRNPLEIPGIVSQNPTGGNLGALTEGAVLLQAPGAYSGASLDSPAPGLLKASSGAVAASDVLTVIGLQSAQRAAAGGGTANFFVTPPADGYSQFFAALRAISGTKQNPTLITTDVWQELSLGGGWTAGSPPPRYMLLSSGLVKLQGAVDGTAATSPVFGLMEPGYIPQVNPQQLTASPTASANVTGYVEVDLSGNVTLEGQAAYQKVWVFNGDIALD